MNETTTPIQALALVLLGLAMRASPCFRVAHDTTAIVQRLGKFLRMAGPGFHIKVPFSDKVIGPIDLRMQQLEVRIETETDDHVRVRMVVAVQYSVVPDLVDDAFATLEDAKRQIIGCVVDVARPHVRAMVLDDVFAKQDEISAILKSELAKVVGGFGYAILEADVTGIKPRLETSGRHSKSETLPDKGTGSHPSQRYPASFGPYLLVDAIGRGGMAEVLLASDPRRAGVHRLCAVKRIHPHLIDEPGYVDMFRDEARFAARLCHPNVCRVFDHGVIDGIPFLAMEYLCGEPLGRVRMALTEMPALPASHPRVVSGARRAAIIARIMADACEGLEAVHELRASDGRSLDAVHRDVSPDNLFLSCAGEVKVVDFGVVKANHKVHQTGAGVIKGKMAYVPPEVMAAAKIDRRADIWALGVIAWELFTGERLFRRESEVATLKAIMDFAIPPPSQRRHDIPDAVNAVVLRALARDPSRRYDSAGDFGRALREAAPGIDTADVAAWMRHRFDHDSLCHQRRALSVGALDDEEMSATPRTAPSAPVLARTPRSVPRPLPLSSPSAPSRFRALGAAAVGLAAGVAVATFAPTSAEPRLRPLVTQAPALHEGAMAAVSKLVASTEHALYIEVRDASGARRLRVPLDELLADALSRAAEPRPTAAPAPMGTLPPPPGAPGEQVTSHW